MTLSEQTGNFYDQNSSLSKKFSFDFISFHRFITIDPTDVQRDCLNAYTTQFEISVKKKLTFKRPYAKYFVNCACRFLIIELFSSKIMTSCKGYTSRCNMEKNNKMFNILKTCCLKGNLRSKKKLSSNERA